MVQNGRVPVTSMTSLLNGQLLLTPKARTVAMIVHIAHLEGSTISCPAGGDRGISGYRDLARQALFVKAAHGDKSAAARCNIDPTMKVSVAPVGQQSHGTADRIDLLFDGHSPDASDIALMQRYGGVQEFGDSDRNHFYISKSVATVLDEDKNRIVARFLNGEHLTHDGHSLTTTTSEDGVWPVKSNMTLLVQVYGSKHSGWYPTDKYHVDGERGPRTIWVRDQIFEMLWAR